LQNTNAEFFCIIIKAAFLKLLQTLNQSKQKTIPRQHNKQKKEKRKGLETSHGMIVGA